MGEGKIGLEMVNIVIKHRWRYERATTASESKEHSFSSHSKSVQGPWQLRTPIHWYSCAQLDVGQHSVMKAQGSFHESRTVSREWGLFFVPIRSIDERYDFFSLIRSSRCSADTLNRSGKRLGNRWIPSSVAAINLSMNVIFFSLLILELVYLGKGPQSSTEALQFHKFLGLKGRAKELSIQAAYQGEIKLYWELLLL